MPKRYRILDPHAAGIRGNRSTGGQIVEESELDPERIPDLLKASAIELVADKPKDKPIGGSGGNP